MKGPSPATTTDDVSRDPLTLGNSSKASAPPPVNKVFDRGVWKRGATIAIVAPTVLYCITDPYTLVILTWFLVFVAMVEWTAMKRHLKVALLHEDGERFPEYPVPVAKTNLFIVCKCFACSLAVFPAAIDAELFGLFMASYFMFWVIFTLMGQNKAETVAAEARTKVRSTFPAGADIGSGDSDATPTPPVSPITLSSLAPKDRFLHQELSVIANKCNTDLFLSFALEYFGFCWIMGLCHGLMLMQLGPLGKIFQVVVIVSNWANDIVALLVGRTLKGKTRPLYPRISPNKSTEGAVAGTIANGICAALVGTYMFNNDTLYFGQDKVPVTVTFFICGIILGVMGVVGDLLQSLFKRSARIKDTGGIFPGHGGVLDRIDGLLLCYPVAFWILWVFIKFVPGAAREAC